MTPVELLKHARQFVFGVQPPPNSAVPLHTIWSEVRVEWRAEDRWAVSWQGEVLNSAGQFEYEPLPSSRDDEFKKRTRFTLDEAVFHAQKLVARLNQNRSPSPNG